MEDYWERIKEMDEIRNALKVLIDHNMMPEQYKMVYETGVWFGDKRFLLCRIY